jgi:hypothetical protein
MKNNKKIVLLFLLVYFVLGCNGEKEVFKIHWVSSDENAHWTIDSIKLINGATCLKTNDENCLAFKNTKNYIIIYYNPDETISSKEFTIDNHQFKVDIAPRSFNTFVI